MLPSFLRVGVQISRAARSRTALAVGGLAVAVGLWVAISAPIVQAQTMDLTVHPRSQFLIQGEATTHDFTCRVDRVDGQATLPAARDSVRKDATDEQTDVVVRVPVRAFDCGNSRMTKDLKETLKIEKHPEIRFELVKATVESTIDTSSQWRALRVLGALSIAGTERLVRIEAVGHALDDHRFRIRGCNPIRMTYFNIEPPTKAFGLIKVKNRIVVQFDLLAHVASETSASPFDVVSIDRSPSCPATTASSS